MTKKKEDKNIYVKCFSCKKNSSREFGESHEKIITQYRLSFDVTVILSVQ